MFVSALVVIIGETRRTVARTRKGSIKTHLRLKVLFQYVIPERTYI